MRSTSTSTLGSRLDLRLAAYAATGAAVAAATVASSAQATVVYSGPVSLSVPANSTGLYLNFVTGASSTSRTAVPSGYDLDLYGSGNTLEFYFNSGTTGSTDNAAVAANGNYVVLAAGAVIGSASTFNTSDAPAATVNFRAPGTTGYLGVRFDNEATGYVDYGWVHVQNTAATGTTTGFPFTVLDYAYDNTGAAITIVPTAVPEPGTTAALAMGALALGAVGMRRWRQSKRLAA